MRNEDLGQSIVNLANAQINTTAALHVHYDALLNLEAGVAELFDVIKSLRENILKLQRQVSELNSRVNVLERITDDANAYPLPPSQSPFAAQPRVGTGGSDE